MGVFNMTCACSNLPIEQPGTPIRAFFLYGSKTAWKPRSWPVRGTYDGYGGIVVRDDPEDTALWNTAIEEIREDLVRVPPGVQAFIAPDDLPDTLWHWIRRKGLYVQSRVGTPIQEVPVDVALVREDAWSAIQSVSLGAATVEDYVQGVTSFWPDFLTVLQFPLPAGSATDWPLDAFHAFVRSISPPLGARQLVLPSDIAALRSHAERVASHEIASSTPALLRAFAEFAFVDDVMDRLSGGWRPSQVLSQDPCWSAHAQLHTKFAQIATQEDT